MKEISSKIIGWEVGDDMPIKDVKPLKRPSMLNSKTYVIKSQLLKSTLYVTISDYDNKPFEIFFNTRDTRKTVELQIITRLLSAIFRRNQDASFVINELKGVANPEDNGYFRPPRIEKGDTKGKYIPSLFYEIGEIIEEHFGIKQEEVETINVIEKVGLNIDTDKDPLYTGVECPYCFEKTLSKQAGCDVCPKCSYSKCG